MRVQIDVLKIDHSQPYHQPKRNQKAENCLCRNEGGSYAALHFPLVGKVHHLLSHQDIDSQGSQQTAHEWGYLSEKNDSQPDNDGYQ